MTLRKKLLFGSVAAGVMAFLVGCSGDSISTPVAPDLPKAGPAPIKVTAEQMKNAGPPKTR